MLLGRQAGDQQQQHRQQQWQQKAWHAILVFANNSGNNNAKKHKNEKQRLASISLNREHLRTFIYYKNMEALSLGYLKTFYLILSAEASLAPLR